MNFEKALNEDNDNLDLFEMANIRPNDTGLSMVIYIGPQFNSKHDPRIKVSTIYGEKVGPSFFTITISDNPQVIGDTGNIKQSDVSKVIESVKNNKLVLLRLWKDEIDPKQAIESFVRAS